MLRKFWTRALDRHAPDTVPAPPTDEWDRLLAAIEPDIDVELEVIARGEVLAAPLTAPIESLEADMDLLALPIITGTLAGRTEAA